MLLASLCVFLGACSAIHRLLPGAQPQADPLARHPETQAIVLVRYGNWTRSLAPAELTHELANVQRDLDLSDSAWAKLRMSLLLTAPSPAVHDDQHALNLLDDVANAGPSTNAQYQDFARLIASLVVAARPDPTGTETVPDPQIDPEVHALRVALAAERSKRRELELQVEALKRLEDSLSQRNKRQE